MSETFQPIYFEFNQPVYAGHGGYVKSITVKEDSAIGLGRCLASSYREDKGFFFFDLLGGTCVAVPVSNVLYAYGESVTTNSEADYSWTLPVGVNPTTDAVAEPPKRRGRPPKVRE